MREGFRHLPKQELVVWQMDDSVYKMEMIPHSITPKYISTKYRRFLLQSHQNTSLHEVDDSSFYHTQLHLYTV